MSQRDECFGGREEHDWFSLAEVGFFLILIGAILVITPKIIDQVKAFVEDCASHPTQVYQDIYLPAPTAPHFEVYSAIMYFCLAFGVFQIVILVLRFAQNSPVSKKAGTLGGIVFWLGAGILASMLVTEGSAKWFFFIGGLIVLIGLSIIVRSLASLLAQPR